MFQASVAVSGIAPATGPEAQPVVSQQPERPTADRAGGTGQDVLSSAAVYASIPAGPAAKAGSAPVSRLTGKDEAGDDSSRDEASSSGASQGSPAPGASNRAAKAYAANASLSSSQNGFPDAFDLTV